MVFLVGVTRLSLSLATGGITRCYRSESNRSTTNKNLNKINFFASGYRPIFSPPREAMMAESHRLRFCDFCFLGALCFLFGSGRAGISETKGGISLRRAWRAMGFYILLDVFVRSPCLGRGGKCRWRSYRSREGAHERVPRFAVEKCATTACVPHPRVGGSPLPRGKIPRTFMPPP